MHKRYTQEQHFDHRRDLAKHDFPPLDQRAIEEERAEAAAYEASVAYYEQYFGSGQ